MKSHPKGLSTPAFPSPLNQSPVNRQALAIGLFPGENWEPKYIPNIVSDVPPALRRPKVDAQQWVGIAGMRRGALVAVSFHHQKKSHKNVWLMRCDCGAYTYRNIDGWLKRVGTHGDQCEACEYKQSISPTGKLSRKTFNTRYARWVRKMEAQGFTREECALCKEYKLPADDLVWLRGALNELAKNVITKEEV